MEELSFETFNEQMFSFIEENEVERIILDLRNNSGGNDAVLKPFTKQIAGYMNEHEKVKVYILIGRGTFSGGMFSIYQTKDAVPNSILVGEPTGGALVFYADCSSFDIPNSGISVTYSKKYFDFTKLFNYKNNGVDACEPDVLIQPTIDDYKEGKDPVLEYALTN